MPFHSDIIVLSQPSERTENLVFLFRLSNFRVAHIAETDEALNFLIQRQKGSSPAKLLVIINAQEQPQFLTMLNELDRQGIHLPILLVYEKDPLPLEQIKCEPHLKNLIQQCRIDESHGCIRETLPASPVDNSQAC